MPLYSPAVCESAVEPKTLLLVSQHLYDIWLCICNSYSAVPAKGHVAHQSVLSRARMRGAEWSPSVPKRASAMELLLCVPPQNQRKTSPLAIQKHKSASVGYVSMSCPLVVLCLVCAVCELVFIFTFFCHLLVWARYVLVPFVRSIIWRCAPVPAKTAGMRQPSCATCAAWRNVSGRLQNCSWAKIHSHSCNIKT